MIVHTGQHYDGAMSQVFLEELDLPAPDHSRGRLGDPRRANRRRWTAWRRCQKEKPDLLVVAGDVNWTLAAMLAAAKIGVPVAHVDRACAASTSRCRRRSTAW